MARACRDCCYDYNKKLLDNGEANKKTMVFKCTQCFKVGKHNGSNKFLLSVLNSVQFKCGDCKRNMTLNVYKTHKQKGQCFEEEHANDF